MGGWGDLRRGTAAALLFFGVAVHAQSPWCNNAAAPTAAAYNCGGRVGMVCPSATEVTLYPLYSRRTVETEWRSELWAGGARVEAGGA
eukprot:COSAG03_NODE_1802_length_3489_cov_9.689676_5_plen_88_part_00